MDSSTLPLETVWQHTNGNLYRVILMTNEQTQIPDVYPVTVVYEGANGLVWSRPLINWHGSMTYKGEYCYYCRMQGKIIGKGDKYERVCPSCLGKGYCGQSKS